MRGGAAFAEAARDARASVLIAPVAAARDLGFEPAPGPHASPSPSPSPSP